MIIANLWKNVKFIFPKYALFYFRFYSHVKIEEQKRMYL